MAETPTSADPKPFDRPGLIAPTIAVSLYWAITIGSRNFDLPTSIGFFTFFGSSLLLFLAFSFGWLLRRRRGGFLRPDGFAVFVVGMTATAFLIDKSLGGMNILLLVVPWVLTLWTVWLLVAAKASPSFRERGWWVTLVPAFAFFLMLRSDGLTLTSGWEFRWRWTPDGESKFLAERNSASPGAKSASIADAAPLVLQPGDWPGFRGPERDGVVRGQKINADWNKTPPRKLWRQRCGPAWSSLTVVGDNVYTQEQRDRDEVVVCYDASTGSERWVHADVVRFYDTQAGAGPRATPTFAGGRLYSLGATGVLNCLDAATGRLVWTRQAAREAEAPNPLWGFASSPLVTDGVVVVFVGGKGPRSLLAYRVEDGAPAWTAEAGVSGYGSPHRAALGGKQQVLFFSNMALKSFDPKSGAVLWEFPAAANGAARPLQPQIVGDRQVLVSSEADMGLVLLDAIKPGESTVTEHWSSHKLKSSFNDLVVYRGFAYGFDKALVACIDLANGAQKWKGGRYGYGQMVLLEDQGLLLVQGESGELALLAATPKGHEEHGRIQAIEGKSWNHPAVVRGRIYVRNAEEIACYDASAK
jgi:hypothetical protein